MEMDGWRGYEAKPVFRHTHSDDFNGGGGTLRSIYARTVHAFGVVERTSRVSARERERGCSASAGSGVAHHDVQRVTQIRQREAKRHGHGVGLAGGLVIGEQAGAERALRRGQSEPRTGCWTGFYGALPR